MRRRIFMNSLSQVTLFAVNIVVAFLLSPVIVRELGDRNYGIWEIMLSVFGYLSLLDLGVSPAFMRFVAHAAARGDRETLDRIVSSAFVFLCGIGLLGMAVMNLVPRFSGAILNLSPGSITGLRLMALFIGITFWVQFSGMAFGGYLMGLQRHTFLNAVQVVLTAARGVVTYFALTRWPGPGLVWLAAILAGVSLLQYGTYAVRVLSMPDAPRVRRRHLSWTALKELYAFGFKSLTLMISERISLWSVPIIIGWLLGAAQVVFYAIPNRLAVYAAGLGAAVGFPLTPYFSSLDGKGDHETRVHAWFELTRWLQFLMFGMAVALIGLGSPFIARWIGPEYAVGGRWVVRLLGAALLVEALAPNASRVLVSMNRHGRAAALALTLAVAGLPITIGLTHFGGIPGVAAAVLLGRAANQAMVLVLACRALELPVREHLRATAFPFLAPVAASLAAVGLLRHAHEAQGYPLIVLYGAIIAGVYVILSWLVALRDTERRAVTAFLRSRLSRRFVRRAG